MQRREVAIEVPLDLSQARSAHLPLPAREVGPQDRAKGLGGFRLLFGFDRSRVVTESHLGVKLRCGLAGLGRVERWIFPQRHAPVLRADLVLKYKCFRSTVTDAKA